MRNLYKLSKRESALGAYITNLRIEKKFRQQDVAKRIGCAASMISQLEAGHKVPTHAKIARLSELFGVSPAEFYNRIQA